MDPAACRVIYIDDRFNTERWISREGASPISLQRVPSQSDFKELPVDLQTNVNAFLSVFNQVYVCRSGRSFSTKLSELHDQVRSDCTPILACFDVGAESKHNHFSKSRPRFSPGGPESPLPSPTVLRREITFSSESDESYGLQLLSRIASDLQVEESLQLIIPVAIVQPKRKDSYDHAIQQAEPTSVNRAPYGSETAPAKVDDVSDSIDPQMMLQCLDAGALDVVRSPLDKAAIMGLTVHAYRSYKHAKNQQKAFMASARKRKQSWVGVEEEKPYAYLREAMVKKLLKGICEPQNVIEDYQHRDLFVEEARARTIAEEVGKWSFSGHDFNENELVYAGYEMLNHALTMAELEQWRMPKHDLLRFMQGCQVAYNSFVLYHNFRHAVDVLQSLFYFLVQIGALAPYPAGAKPAPKANDRSPVARLLGPFEALSLLISAIGHDVGHPGVNNMFLVKLNAPLAQLYNDSSVLEAFHCAAYSQILRRHWPAVFHDKSLRKLMISTILATDMGVHSDYMQQMGNLQSKIHETKTTDSWSPKDVEANRILTCGLLIKCADISNVARPWAVAEKWTHLLQREFAHQGEMESAVGMETTLFGGPPELGNMLKLANGQIGFMTIFAHPLFANVADLVPAMSFAAEEILTNKGVWFTRAEQEKKKKQLTLRDSSGFRDGGAISPRSQSPVRRKGDDRNSYFPSSPLRARKDVTEEPGEVKSDGPKAKDSDTPKGPSRSSSLAAAAGIVTDVDAKPGNSLSEQRMANAAFRPSQDLSSQTDGQAEPLSETPRSLHASGDDVPQNPQNCQSESDAVTADANHYTEEHLSDPRRDHTVSMRAGTETIPLAPSPEQTNSDLSKFTFATSDKDEPVRTYDSNQAYHPAHPEIRASAPMNNIKHEQQRSDMKEDATLPLLAKSESNTVGTSIRGGGTDEQQDPLTPSQSTTATSYTSEQSEQTSPTPRATEWNRNRATSAPLANAPFLKQSYSLDKNGEGSKNAIRTTISANSELVEDHTSRGRRQNNKTLGNKSSRMRLKNLAFWKKRDRSACAEDRAPADST